MPMAGLNALSQSTEYLQYVVSIGIPSDSVEAMSRRKLCHSLFAFVSLDQLTPRCASGDHFDAVCEQTMGVGDRQLFEHVHTWRFVEDQHPPMPMGKERD